MTTPRLEQWERGWRAFCPDCAWNSKDLPFPDPDAALHCLALHKVVCEAPTVTTLRCPTIGCPWVYRAGQDDPAVVKQHLSEHAATTGGAS